MKPLFKKKEQKQKQGDKKEGNQQLITAEMKHIASQFNLMTF